LNADRDKARKRFRRREAARRKRDARWVEVGRITVAPKPIVWFEANWINIAVSHTAEQPIELPKSCRVVVEKLPRPHGRQPRIRLRCLQCSSVAGVLGALTGKSRTRCFELAASVKAEFAAGTYVRHSVLSLGGALHYMRNYLTAAYTLTARRKQDKSSLRKSEKQRLTKIARAYWLAPPNFASSSIFAAAINLVSNESVVLRLRKAVTYLISKESVFEVEIALAGVKHPDNTVPLSVERQGQFLLPGKKTCRATFTLAPGWVSKVLRPSIGGGFSPIGGFRLACVHNSPELSRWKSTLKILVVTDANADASVLTVSSLTIFDERDENTPPVIESNFMPRKDWVSLCAVGQDRTRSAL
jgi:hypothetical protein